jgi:hypothetical protein
MFAAFEYTDAAGHAHRFYFQEEADSEDGASTVEISIWPTPNIVLGTSPYFARFKYIAPGMLQVAWIGNDKNSWAIGVDLSEAVFGYVARKTGAAIVSSRAFVEGSRESQTGLARNMWLRFQGKGLASWDAAEERFLFIPPV